MTDLKLETFYKLREIPYPLSTQSGNMDSELLNFQLLAVLYWRALWMINPERLTNEIYL